MARLERVRKLILFPPEMVEMIEQFQSEKMLPSFTVSVIQLILVAFDSIKAERAESISEE